MATASTYTLLQRVQLNSSASSVTFSNIPQTGYTDLCVKGSVRSDVNANYEDLSLLVNGSSSNFQRRRVGGTGSAAFSDYYAINTPGIAVGATATASTYTNFELYIPNYTSSNGKSMSYDTVTENNATAAVAQMDAVLWNVSDAITSLNFYVASSNLVAGSTFSLYAVSATGTTPGTPKALGGDIIRTDGTYWYHAFLNTGLFTPQAVSITCDYLVVAGGGGGGSGYYAGGGGAGGLLSFTSQAVTAPSLVIVGAGGAASTKGNNSQFASSTAVVGGGYGGPQSTAGGNGGSGGGSASVGGGSALAGGTGTSGQGNAGGYGFNRYESVGAGGGGGGQSAAGGNGTTNVGGNGGNGSSSFSSWGSITATGQNVGGTYYFAGGGGGAGAGTGGTGGNGGGANGRAGFSGVVGNSGLATTGGGGGGANLGDPIWPGGAGGSGIVIVRYAV